MRESSRLRSRRLVPVPEPRRPGAAGAPPSLAEPDREEHAEHRVAVAFDELAPREVHKHVDAMLWASLAIIVVFGGATLVLQDETFIKWKPTVLYWLLGAVLGGAPLFFRRNLVRAMLSEQVQLPDPVWSRLNWSWVGFFVFMGALNLYVAYNYSTDLWVNFKLFGGMGLMLVFVVAQAFVLARHVEDKQ